MINQPNALFLDDVSMLVKYIDSANSSTNKVFESRDVYIAEVFGSAFDRFLYIECMLK